MTRWALASALGACPPLTSLHARASLGPGGVDHRLAATLEFPDGIVSQFICGFEMSADNSLRIIGEHGTISVPTFWQATEALLRVAGREPEAARRPFRINGFEYEIEEAVAAIARGGIESDRIPHAETLETLAWMDRIRAMVGVRYPFDVALEATSPVP
jgi:predicted dehydrogenase